MLGYIFAGLKRHTIETKPPVQRAKPLSRQDLKKLNDFLLSGPRTLRQWRTVWRVNLAFFCLLRWDDVRRLEVMLSKTCEMTHDCEKHNPL
jgi:hypothetical protein